MVLLCNSIFVTMFRYKSATISSNYRREGSTKLHTLLLTSSYEWPFMHASGPCFCVRERYICLIKAQTIVRAHGIVKCTLIVAITTYMPFQLPSLSTTLRRGLKTPSTKESQLAHRNNPNKDRDTSVWICVEHNLGGSRGFLC